MPMKVREILRLLAEDGWVAVRQTGSHQVFKHHLKSGIVVAPIQDGKDLGRGTGESILKQAGLKGK